MKKEIDAIKRRVLSRLDEVNQYPDTFKCSCGDVKSILKDILGVIEKCENEEAN